MIGSVRGTLLYAEEQEVVVEAGGVGYTLSVPSSTRWALPPVGREVFLWVHTYVRENGITLYGFASRDEMVLFRELLEVSGVGPRLALMILSTFAPGDFRRIIAAGDGASLTRVPGVGKKTAQRLLFELKGKLPLPQDEGAVPVSSMGGAWADALEALVSLGYSREEAVAALGAVVDGSSTGPVDASAMGDQGGDFDAAALVRAALRRLAG